MEILRNRYKLILFKLKSFPHITETFTVSNLIYAKQNGFAIKIIVNKFLGINNSSQNELFQKYNIEDNIVKPFQFKKNKFVKLFQVLHILSNPRVLMFSFRYYKLKRKKNLTPLAILYQYRNVKNNIVHIHFNNALEPLVSLAKIGYIDPKCIITFHGYDAFLENGNSFQKKYGEFYKKHVLAVTVNSNYLKEEVLKLGIDSSKIKVIPIGIDTSIYKGQPKQKLQNKSLKLLTVGRLVQLKGQKYAIRAISQLVQQGYNVEYYIVGDGNYLTVLKKEVKRLNLSRYIFFEGAKQQDDILGYLRKSDIFIISSTYDDIVKRREAFGIVSIEAQAMGLPIIGFQSGGFPETIIEGETGFAVEDRNVDALVSKIEYLIDNPELYQSMSKAAIKHAQSFDHKHKTQQYLDLYTQFLN
jgi:colanic acid/amylovoran biosynthesis glycosyltransferase